MTKLIKMINIIKIITLSCCFIVTCSNALAQSNIKDPTKPLIKDPRGLDVQGISEVEGSYYCLINQRVYEVGDKILDFKISKIEFEKVFFEDIDGQITEILL